jgi:hypothetical protein
MLTLNRKMHRRFYVSLREAMADMTAALDYLEAANNFGTFADRAAAISRAAQCHRILTQETVDYIAVTGRWPS